ncbi:unnamed protein product [Clonostachys rosea f. rosea IK726]|uniref:Uncharacterized protein n=1 Tax=Clonostachys rosea f. rosea IK726 TaxID=1349383 RepID=A0ACA9T7F8_BIOOC|nr:unnamed protein product [Clonostachys rosea f. rosea IK726]
MASNPRIIVRQATILVDGKSSSETHSRRRIAAKQHNGNGPSLNQLPEAWDTFIADMTGMHSVAALRRSLVAHGRGHGAVCLVVAITLNHMRRLLLPSATQFFWPHALADMKLARSSPHRLLEQSVVSFDWLPLAAWAVLAYLLAMLPSLLGQLRLLEEQSARATAVLVLVALGLHFRVLPVAQQAVRGHWPGVLVYLGMGAGTAYMVRYSNKFFILLELADMWITLAWFGGAFVLHGMEVLRRRVEDDDKAQTEVKKAASHPDLVLCKGTDDRVDQTSVVEDDEIAFLPVVGVYPLGSNARSLQTVDSLANLGQVINDGAIGQMKPPHSRRVDLKVQLPRHGVAPAHGEDLDGLGVDGREVGLGELLALRDEAEPGGAGLGRRHPDVRMGGVFDLGGAGKLLVLVREDVVHGFTVGESSSSKGDGHLIARAVVISQCLRAARGDADGKQRGRHGGREIIEGGINVPAVEPGEVEVLCVWNCSVMECPVVRVPELDVLQTLVGRHKAVSNDLDLGLMRNRLQIRVQDRAFCIQSLAVAIVGSGFRVKSLGEAVLGLGRDVRLVPDDENLMSEQSITKDIKVGICRAESG